MDNQPKVRLIYQEPVEKPTYYYNERLDGYKCECEIINKDVYFQSDLFRGIMLKVGDTDAWEELCAMKRSREEDNVIPNVKMDEEYRPIKRLYVLDKISSKTDDDGRRIVSFERFKGVDEVERGRNVFEVNVLCAGRGGHGEQLLGSQDGAQFLHQEGEVLCIVR